MATYNTTGSRAGMPTNIPTYKKTTTTNAINVNTDPRFTAPSTVGTNNAPKYNQGIVGSSSSYGSSGSGSGSGLGSNSSSSSSYYSGGGSYDTGFSSSVDTAQQAYQAYLDQIRAQEAAERARAEEAAAARRQAAQNAYDRGMGYLKNAYNTQLGTLKSNYDSALGQLNSSYDRSANAVNQDAANSLQQAYINRMISERGMNQAMSAQGLSGGASETTLANLYNNYGNARNNIENTKATNLSNLAGIRDDSLAKALQSYNTQLADAENRRMGYAMDLENALANNEIAAMADYQSALSSNNSQYLNALTGAMNNLNNYVYDATQANNEAILSNVMQNAQNAERARALYQATQDKRYANQAAEYEAASRAASQALQNTYGKTSNDYLKALLNSL